MKRLFFAASVILVALAITSPARPQSGPKVNDAKSAKIFNGKNNQLDPSQLTVGTVGRLDYVQDKVGGGKMYLPRNFEIVRVISDTEMGIVPERGAGRFILQGPTAGMADGRRLRLQGVYEVVGTKRMTNGTYYVLEKLGN